MMGPTDGLPPLDGAPARVLVVGGDLGAEFVGGAPRHGGGYSWGFLTTLRAVIPPEHAEGVRACLRDKAIELSPDFARK
jgi:hypothetical protein